MGQYELTVAGADYNSYELNINNAGNNGTSRIQLSMYIADQPFPGGLSADEIAEAFRDWVATLSGYGSSVLERVEVARTAL